MTFATSVGGSASDGPTSPRIGVFGGTFDPPHVGHLVAAIDAAEHLALDRVLWVVANVPWQKVGEREISGADDRLAMVAAAVRDVEGQEASDIELRRGGTSFTADTLHELRENQPQAELFLILGHDAAAGFLTWERHEEVAELAHLVVVDRPGSTARLQDGFAWTRIDIPELEISSTELRRRCVEGRSIRFLVPDGVASLIEQRGLYRLDR